jgi:hypothetical protein
MVMIELTRFFPGGFLRQQNQACPEAPSEQTKVGESD